MADQRHREHWTPFVEGVVADPADPPSTLLLLGYLGASSEADHTRLYFDPQLSDYVEIPDDAILHVETPPAESSDPLRATWVWIDRNAEVLRGPVGTERSPASFLEGSLRSARSRGGGAESGMDTTTHPPMGVTSCHPPGSYDTTTHPPQGVTNCHPPPPPPPPGEDATHTHPPGGVTNCHPPPYGEMDTTTHPPAGVTNCHPKGYAPEPYDTLTHPPMGITNCHPQTITHPPQGPTNCQPPPYGNVDTTTHPPHGVTNCHPHGYGPVAYDTHTHPPQGVTGCHPPGGTWPPTYCCPTAWCRHGW